MTEIIGLDVGGAHVKLARTAGGAVLGVRQVPCPLWQGLDHLRAAMSVGLEGWPAEAVHAITMTAELADLFDDRAGGVRAILATLAERIDAARLQVYGIDGFLSAEEAAARPEQVASANWHATGRLVAMRLGHGLLLDIGSTTTDIVPLRDGAVIARGLTDAQRLARDELVYTGVVRTPVMAVARHAAFAGERVGVMAEAFATMADVHRLTGELPAHADQHPTADGRGKSVEESRARLARMIGCDAAASPRDAWEALAHQLARRQLHLIEVACERVLSGAMLPPAAPLVGAGVGRFLAERLADRLLRPYRSFGDLVDAPAEAASMAADCAPAVAVAILLHEAM